MSKTQLFSKLVDERERCRVERLKIILEQVGRATPTLLSAGTSPQPCSAHAVPEQPDELRNNFPRKTKS